MAMPTNIKAALQGECVRRSADVCLRDMRPAAGTATCFVPMVHMGNREMLADGSGYLEAYCFVMDPPQLDAPISGTVVAPSAR